MQCPECGFFNGVNNSHCASCGEGLPLADGTVPPPIAPATAFDSVRPDGRGLIIVAWVMAFLAAALWGISALQENTNRYGEMELNGTKIVLAWLGSGMFSLAVTVWAVGQIVKAISFLPGKGD